MDFRIMGRRNKPGLQLYTRNGYNFADRFPRIVKAVAKLPVQSCFIGGEAIVIDERGLSTFELLRSRRHDDAAVRFRRDRVSMAGICAGCRSSSARLFRPNAQRKSRLKSGHLERTFFGGLDRFLPWEFSLWFRVGEIARLYCLRWPGICYSTLGPLLLFRAHDLLQDCRAHATDKPCQLKLHTSLRALA
jgi:hypothetical protein